MPAYAGLANALSGLSANDPLELARLRAKRKGELEDALVNNPPVDPKTDPLGAASNARLKALLGIVSADDAADPLGEQAQSKRAMAAQDTLDQAALERNPQVTALRQQQLAPKVAVAEAPAKAQAAGALAVEQEKTRGKIQEMQTQEQNTKDLLSAMTGGSAQSSIAGPGGSIKPTINAQGGVSFTTTQMPALVQRAHNQLTDARNKTIMALQEAERLYPGINDESNKADTVTSSGPLAQIGSFLTGAGALKYGTAADYASARMSRLNYTMGIPTPFANLAQEASFGNIEQMAGQLPGVRGLSTLTPLFKEHQSRWGYETPLATVQRLRHMASIMDDTLSTIEQGVTTEGAR